MGRSPNYGRNSNIFHITNGLNFMHRKWYTATSQFHRKYYFGQEEEEMKLCLMILSVPWYMFNGLEHTAILSHFLTFITGSSSRLLRIQIYAAVTLYWFPVRHFRCKEFNPLVIWIWNQNIAISWMLKNDSKLQCVLAH
jgi:hypothetical protein